MVDGGRVEVAGGRFFVEPWGAWQFLISSALVEVADGCGYVVSVVFDVRSEDAGVIETAFVGPDGERSWSPRELSSWREAIEETESLWWFLGENFPELMREYHERTGLFAA